MHNKHINVAKKSLRERDSLRNFMHICVTFVFPTFIALFSAIISFVTDSNIKSPALTGLIMVAVLTVVFGVFLNGISSKEFYSLVFDHDDIKNDNELLKYQYLLALEDSLRYVSIADTMDYVQMQNNIACTNCNQEPISLKEVKQMLNEALAPIESTIAEMFMLDKNDYYSFSVYLKAEDDKLYSAYRVRNFKEGEESRAWALDAHDSHIVSTFQRKMTIASSNIWTTDMLATSDSIEDKKYYTSFICSPIFSKGFEENPSEALTKGVVCVTSNIENHFGPDNSEEGALFHQSSRIKNRMLAATVSSLLTKYSSITI